MVVEELKGEQNFIHSLANALAIGSGNVEVLIIKLTSNPDLTHEFILSRLDHITKAFATANALIKARRAELQTKE